MKIFYMLFFFAGMSFISCSNEKVVKPDPYEGPMLEMHDFETLYSDSARLKIRFTGPYEYELQNGDKVFPEGVYMEFFDLDTREMTSTLKGNEARYFKDRNIYVVNGDVVVHNLKEKNKLSSEELIWNPTEKKITTEKFVRIETPCEIMTGDGMVSNEDFTSYRILKPSANIFMDCE